MRTTLVAIGVVVASALACGEQRVDTPSEPAPLLDPSFLISPAIQGRFRQNDPTIGCSAHAARGRGFRLAFDWRDVEGAGAYKIVFWQRQAIYPAIERVVTASEYAETRCQTFVIDRNLNDWVWKVAALGGSRLNTIVWSEERTFGFEPCRLEDGRPCYAPPD